MNSQLLTDMLWDAIDMFDRWVIDQNWIREQLIFIKVPRGKMAFLKFLIGKIIISIFQHGQFFFNFEFLETNSCQRFLLELVNVWNILKFWAKNKYKVVHEIEGRGEDLGEET